MGIQSPEQPGTVGVPLEALKGGPPLPLWVTPDDLLIVGHRSSVAGLTLRLGGLIWRPNGEQHELNYNILPTSDRSLNFFSTPLAHGYLVTVAMGVAVGAPKRGQCLVSLQIARPPASGFRTRWFLGQDYLTSQDSVYWPGGRNLPGVEGPGVPLSVNVGAPGAGSDWSQIVPANTRWLIHGVRATLATSATAATRIPMLRINDPLIQGDLRVLPSNSQIASLTQTWYWVPGYPSIGQSLAAQNVNAVGLPFPLVVNATWAIQVTTAGLQVGDAWAAIQLFVEELIED